MKDTLIIQSRPFLIAQALIMLLVAGSTVEAGYVVDLQASSGNKPDEIANPWTHVDKATPEQVVLSGGILTLSTSTTAESMYYIQTGSLLDSSSPFYIEARLKYVSDASTAAYRAPISIGFTVEPNVGNALHIDEDEVFFAAGDITATDSDFNRSPRLGSTLPLGGARDGRGREKFNGVGRIINLSFQFPVQLVNIHFATSVDYTDAS